MNGPAFLKHDSRSRAYLRSFMRCYMAGAGFNTRGMQNIGLMFAMMPGLRTIHTDPKELKAALKRYVSHYQSHPFWLPCLVAIYLSVEASIAAGRFPAKMFAKVKDTTAYTLSAIGDSMFAGSLLIFWALSTICLLLVGLRGLALAEGVILFLTLQGFRAYTFVGGLRDGFKFLERLKRWDLINWGRRIKYVNAGLLVCLWAIIWPGESWWDWALGVSALMLFGRFVRIGLMARIFAAAIFLALIDSFTLVEAWIKNAL